MVRIDQHPEAIRPPRTERGCRSDFGKKGRMGAEEARRHLAQVQQAHTNKSADIEGKLHKLHDAIFHLVSGVGNTVSSDSRTSREGRDRLTVKDRD